MLGKKRRRPVVSVGESRPPTCQWITIMDRLGSGQPWRGLRGLSFGPFCTSPITGSAEAAGKRWLAVSLARM